MAEPERSQRVAVACQGGGSHTAFTAGVLQELLLDRASDIRALSGTSGGAVCALLAWYGLLRHDPEDGRKRLDAFWKDNATHGIWQALSEKATLAVMRTIGELGVTPELSPYRNPLEPHREFLRLIERHLPFAEITSTEIDPAGPRLLVSATEVGTGEFRVFRSHPVNGYDADRITSGVILASAAIPTLFRAVPLGDGVYWDGVFAQNPPIRELVDAARTPTLDGAEGAPPDELWVIQINPDERDSEPTSMNDIRDRRNELSSNISYQQEIFFIGQMNKLIQQKMLTAEALDKYQLIKIRAITMSDDVARTLDYESKLCRNPEFLRMLINHGRKRGRLFLDRLDSPDADEVTTVRSRDIWGRWTAPVPPYTG